MKVAHLSFPFNVDEVPLHTVINMIAFLLLALLVAPTIQSGAFTTQTSISSRQIPTSTILTSSLTSTRARPAINLGMSDQRIDASHGFDVETRVGEICTSPYLNGRGINESVKKWVLKLFSFETSNSVCRCLVRAAKLLEDDSYQTMVHAYEHGEGIIRESCQEPAEE